MCLDGLGREKGKEKVVAYKKIKKINKFKFKCERKNGKKKKFSQVYSENGQDLQRKIKGICVNMNINIIANVIVFKEKNVCASIWYTEIL